MARKKVAARPLLSDEDARRVKHEAMGEGQRQEERRPVSVWSRG